METFHRLREAFAPDGSLWYLLDTFQKINGTFFHVETLTIRRH